MNRFNADIEHLENRFCPAMPRRPTIKAVERDLCAAMDHILIDSHRCQCGFRNHESPITCFDSGRDDPADPEEAWLWLPGMRPGAGKSPDGQRRIPAGPMEKRLMNVVASTLHAPIFRFDEEEHRYFLGDDELPSVTTILAASFPFRGFSGLAELACERGTIVHKACELDDLGTLDETTLDEEFWPYLKAWRAFREEHGFVPEGIEVRRYHPQRKYAGTIDRIGRMRSGRHMVIDIKTGGLYAHYQLQLAAYVFLLDNPFEYHRGLVLLNPDGSFELEEYSKEGVHQDIGYFHSAHNVYKFKLEHRLLDRRMR